MVDRNNIMRSTYVENLTMSLQRALSDEVTIDVADRIEDARRIIGARPAPFDIVFVDLLWPAIGEPDDAKDTTPRGLELVEYCHEVFPTTFIVAFSIGNTAEQPNLLEDAKELGAHIAEYRFNIQTGRKGSGSGWDRFSAEIERRMKSMDRGSGSASSRNVAMNAKTSRPSLFIGSSAEGLDVASALQVLLDHECEVELWNQGTFGLTSTALESLTEAARRFDFAIMVVLGEDNTVTRGHQRLTPRDNVMFELGLFLGSLGRQRTFLVFNRDSPPDLPTDLAGVTAATFSPHSTGNMQAALGPSAHQITRVVKQLGRKP